MRTRALPALLLLAPLAACASAGAPPPVTAAYAPPPSEAAAVRAQALNAAAELERAGRLRDALWRLEVAQAADPSGADVAARLDRLHARMTADAARLADEGAALERAGRLAPARARYAQALELDPTSPAARSHLEAMTAPETLAAIARSPAGGPRPPAVRAYAAKARRPAHRSKTDG